MLLFQMMISLDGYFEGPERQIDWHTVDDKFNNYAVELMNSVDALVFGRVTYQLMETYWPSEDASKNDPVVAGIMNSHKKIVFSNTLKEVKWNNTQLIKGDAVEEMGKLKEQNKKDMVIFGSSDLAASLIPHGLIDEIRIIMSPVILGEGKTLFEGIRERHTLKLKNSKVFGNGNVLLSYSF
jgi:dihydrofolate reductase